MSRSLFAAGMLFLAGASAYDLPDNLKSIYDQHMSGSCGNALSGTFDGGAAYCGDINGAIFLKSDGAYDNMDIDCDGANNSAGKCSNDPSGQGQTAFQSQVQQFGISDLDANIHPYVVFGTADYDPQQDGLAPLSVMAVVCNNQVFYGVWGDTNGASSTGEASISLADLCFPDEGLNGDNGHGPSDVLYLGFTSGNASSDSANWSAGNTQDFEDSIKSIGDQLVAGLSA